MEEKTTTTIDLLARRHFFFFLVCFTFSLFVVLLLPRRRFSISLGDWLIDDVEIVRQQPTNKPKKETTSPWDSYCFVFVFVFFFPLSEPTGCVWRESVCTMCERTKEKKKHQNTFTWLLRKRSLHKIPAATEILRIFYYPDRDSLVIIPFNKQTTQNKRKKEKKKKRYKIGKQNKRHEWIWKKKDLLGCAPPRCYFTVAKLSAVAQVSAASSKSPAVGTTLAAWVAVPSTMCAELRAGV